MSHVVLASSVKAKLSSLPEKEQQFINKSLEKMEMAAIQDIIKSASIANTVEDRVYYVYKTSPGAWLLFYVQDDNTLLVLDADSQPYRKALNIFLYILSISFLSSIFFLSIYRTVLSNTENPVLFLAPDGRVFIGREPQTLALITPMAWPTESIAPSWEDISEAAPSFRRTEQAENIMTLSNWVIGFVGSCITTFLSFVGFLLTTYFSWGKDSRERRATEVDLQIRILELEKMKADMEKLKKQKEPKGPTKKPGKKKLAS
jgi:hypothetical protein